MFQRAIETSGYNDKKAEASESRLMALRKIEDVLSPKAQINPALGLTGFYGKVDEKRESETLSNEEPFSFSSAGSTDNHVPPR